MTTRLGRVVTFHEEVPLIKVTWPLNHIVFWYYMTILKHLVVVVTVPMATKFTRVVLEWLLPIILLKPLVTWSCKITWQTKNISTTTVCMSTKLGRMVTNLQQLLPIILLYLWLCVLERSFDRGKTYLRQHDVCDHQTWQGCAVPWEDPIHKVTWPLNHMVLQNHVTNQSHYISTTMMPMTTKPGRGATYHEGLPIKLHGYIITWSCEITDKLKSYIHCHNTCGNHTLAGWVYALRIFLP